MATPPDSPSPHDAFFKALVSPQRALVLLRDHLPADIAAMLDDTPPELVEGTYIDKALRNTRSDRLFKARLKAGGAAFVYVLLEHKSSPDPDTPLQLAGYMLNIWSDLSGTTRRGKHPGRRRALPPIIPIVFYHGAAKWSAPRSLGEMMAGGDALRPFAPDFPRYVLLNLETIPREDLSSDKTLHVGFRILFHATRKPHSRALLTDILRRWAGATGADRGLQEQGMRYILRGFDVQPETYDEAAQAARLRTGGEPMSSIAQRLEERGEARGEARGRAVGLAEGEAKSLARLLQRRFGPLPAAVRSRIAAASVDELDDWTDQVLDAPSLEAIFDGGRRHV